LAWWKFWEKRSSVVNTNYSGDNWDVLLSIAESQKSNSGVSVTENNAMQITAVGAAVRILSESIASLPLMLYARTKNGGRSKATWHPLFNILHDQPNPLMTAMTFRELLMSHVLLWGNGYAEIEWDNAGQIVGLWPLRPDVTTPLYDPVERELIYRTIINGEVLYLPAYRVLHIYGLGFDGIKGYSPISMYREAIGLAKATEKYGSKFFGSGAKPGGVLEHPNNLSEEAATRLRNSWNEMHSGLDNAHRVAVLEEGLTYKQIGLPPEDSQFLETRKFQIEEISRIYRVPPHMLGSLDRATFSNIEHQGIEFVTHTLRPWLVRTEQAISIRCLTNDERKKYYSEHMADALLRGDTKSRYEAYAIARQNGWLNADEIREKENMSPTPNGEGQVYLVNGNMIPVHMAGQQYLKGGDGGNEGQGATGSNNSSGAASE
jgi:HK97 family phage portal protein